MPRPLLNPEDPRATEGVTVRMATPMHTRLFRYCEAHALTYSEAVRQFIEVGLARAEGDEAQAKATRRARR